MRRTVYQCRTYPQTEWRDMPRHLLMNELATLLDTRSEGYTVLLCDAEGSSRTEWRVITTPPECGATLEVKRSTGRLSDHVKMICVRNLDHDSNGHPGAGWHMDFHGNEWIV